MAAITSEVIEDDGNYLRIRVVKLKTVPDNIAEIRARARALVARGLANTTVDKVGAGELERLTQVDKERTSKLGDGPASQAFEEVIFRVTVTN